MVIHPVLDPDDHARLTREIRNAEATTSGEIYVVVAHSADEFRFVPLLWGIAFALLLPWFLRFATNLSVTMILSLQAVGFMVVSAILSLPALRYRVVPPVIAGDAAHRAALAQFMAHGVHLNAERTGVLLYVCMVPRRIEVVADSAIHAKVSSETWQKTLSQIATEAREGRLVEGLAAAIRTVGAVLAEHFPRSAEHRHERSNRVVEG
jgi:putative membrane protein